MLRFLFVLIPLAASFFCASAFDGMIYNAELGTGIGLLLTGVALTVATGFWIAGCLMALARPRVVAGWGTFSVFLSAGGVFVAIAGLAGLYVHYTQGGFGPHSHRFGYFPYVWWLMTYAGALTAIGSWFQHGRD
ncbi:hypothetical protein AWH62_08690 [Maricaulis sp. W15]|uniref:Transmembrane protein n=1 Tax=Maricaulis maris TaxID=74318 RepID=A0A495DK14_9PROT|nr:MULTISPECIES: hypothetical protein [Maricaulis]OLF73021.1 hypothetical protein AWH62_08690 [Maricaulis sp. W15]RKR02959.1 hypothetical protein C7435_0904 [Maricaulis maris]